MDSLTQIALGAAVGEATLGRRAGRAGAAWGAVLGTVPDLDVLIAPFLDPVSELAAHRSLSHSIVFAVAAAPVAGWMLARLHRSLGVPPWSWSWMAFLALVTHLALDIFTVYGTQIFFPFSRHPVGFDSIFIIDPLYTAPLAAGVLVSVWRRKGRPNRIGLTLSSAYLAWTLVGKAVAERSFLAALDGAGVVPERVMTTPTPLNTLLWMGIAVRDDSLYVGLTGLFDNGPDRRITVLPRNARLLAGHESDRAVACLTWFTKGWWAAEEGEGNSVFVNDLRFGRTDGFLGASGDFVFRWRLVGSESWDSLEQIPPRIRFSTETLAPLWRRIVDGPATEAAPEQKRPGLREETGPR